MNFIDEKLKKFNFQISSSEEIWTKINKHLNFNPKIFGHFLTINNSDRLDTCRLFMKL